MDTAILSSKGIVKGLTYKDMQHYTVIGEDKEGKVFLMSFACQLNFTEMVEKAFSKLYTIPAPLATTEEEGDKNLGTDENAGS